MGLDEVLLRSVGMEPTLRLYSWRPDALSLGYFQAFEDVPAAQDHAHVVRRLTGGGAIHHHAGELTFSIAIAADDPAYGGSVPASYERTHEAIMVALRELGVSAPRMRREGGCDSDLAATGMCFHASTSQDIGWANAKEGDGAALFRKGVGTAQRRSGGRILHHGSIKLSGSPLEPEIATVDGSTGTVTLAAAGAALKGAIAAEFGATLEIREPAAAELESARELGRRYRSEAFVHRAVRRSQ